MYKEIDFNKVSEYFIYDETSPTFLRWRINKGNKKAGDIAGYKRNKYYCVKFDGDDYYVHRVIWVLFNGGIDASLVIDHIDMNPANNNINNLRLVPQKVNLKNQGKRIDNGLPKYVRQIERNGKPYYIAQIPNLLTGKRISKSSSNLDVIIEWLENKFNP